MVKNPLQDLLSSLNAVISTNESTQIITGHVIYNPAYTYKFQLKTTQVRQHAGIKIWLDQKIRENSQFVFGSGEALNNEYGLNDINKYYN